MKNGSFDVDGKSIGVSMTRSEFLTAFPSAQLVIESGQYRTYRIGPANVRHRRLFIHVVFFNEVPRQISFTKAHGPGASWGDLSAERLGDEKIENDEWLASEFGIASGRFSAPWGRLESVVDKRTGSASIVLSFAESDREP